MSKRPSKRFKHKRNVNGIDRVMKTEAIEDDMVIKMEPPDNEYEVLSMPQPRTIVYAQNDVNRSSVEAEIGLVSELEFIKSEIDVDETTLREFRAEILSNNDLKQNEEQMQPFVLVDRLDESIISIAEKKITQKDEQLEQQSNNIAPIGKSKKKILKCPLCDFQTTTRNRSYLLKDHMRTHTGETPYSCPFCVQKFRSNTSLLAHVTKSHPRQPILRCELCRQISYGAEAFAAHKLNCVKVRSFECYLCKFTLKRVQMYSIKKHMRKSHTGEKVYGCSYCSEKFISESSVSSHKQRMHPNILKLTCSICKRRYKEKDKLQLHEQVCRTRMRFECHICRYSCPKLSHKGLKEHMRKHTGVKPFPCCYCPKFFPRAEALSQHLQRHAEKYTFQCRRCHRRCLDAKSLEQHEQVCKRRRYECYMCGFTKFGISFSKFRRHILIQHTGESKIQCSACPKKFASSNVFGTHLTVHHPHLLAYLCLVCNKRFDSKVEKKIHQDKCTRHRLECFLCRNTSSNMKKLRTHMIWAHTGEKNFECKICLRKFQMKHNLDNHMRSHGKNGLVKCSYCSKKFIDIKYAKKHEFQCKRIYECYLCKKIFPSFSILHGKHMKTHLGEKPYVCKHCGRTIGSVRCYKLHVINYHLASYRFKCNVCNGIILVRKHFRDHQKTCMKPIRRSANVTYFTCSLCGVGLKRLPELRQHIELSECKEHPQLRKKIILPRLEVILPRLDVILPRRTY